MTGLYVVHFIPKYLKKSTHFYHVFNISFSFQLKCIGFKNLCKSLLFDNTGSVCLGSEAEVGEKRDQIIVIVALSY